MAKYTFQFEAVGKQRQAQEDQCQRELAKVLRQQMILQHQLRGLSQTITQSKQNLADGLVGQVDMKRVSAFANFSGQEAIRGQQIIRQMALIERNINQAREKLIQATRKRKAMDVLRDRYRKRWLRQQEIRQQAMADEQAGQQFIARQMAGSTR